MRKRLKGSFTIEAAFVMAFVLWAVLFSVQSAFRLRDETVGAMALHGGAERLCHGEKEQSEEAEAYASRLVGKPFSWNDCDFQIEEYGAALTGREVRAVGKGGTWHLEIKQKKHDPENFLRLFSLLNREE